MSTNDSFLDRIASVPVTKEELQEYAKAMADAGDLEARSFEVRTIWLVQKHGNDPIKASAIEFRMQALARVFEAGRIEGWTLPRQADGGVPTHDAAFAAAAVEPLILVERQPAFDRSSFIQRVLELADADGNA